jgi:hypothetical protein
VPHSWQLIDVAVKKEKMTAPLPGNTTSTPDSPSRPASASSITPSSSNVRVVARIRPLAKYEQENGSKQIVSSLPSSSKSNSQSESESGNNEPEVLQVSTSSDKRWFELDAVLDASSSQEDVYVQSGAKRAVCHDLIQGFNCTILAYGQTGSGKTFTMGSAAGNNENDDGDGVITRACRDLFVTLQQQCDGNAQVQLSYLEIYNEEIRDLMVDTSKANAALKIRETLDGETYVSGLTWHPVSTPAEIGVKMEQASNRRVVASTKMNFVSSRSHAICVLNVKGVLEDASKFEAKLTLVDLAGSERIKKTGAQGDRRQEGININKGLFVLGQVISALAEVRPKFQRQPAYRDSKLTRLLQNSLGGNSRTLMIACVSPAECHFDETIQTLRYATSARNIKNTATRNVVPTLSAEQGAQLLRENELLKQQVQELQETIQQMSENAAAASSDVDSDDSDNIVDDPEASDRILPLHKDVSDTYSVIDAADEEKTNDHEKSLTGDDLWALEKADKPTGKKAAKAFSSSSRSLHKSLGENAIELSTLHLQVATMKQELQAAQELKEEHAALQDELNECKADAQSSRLAANQLSNIMEQLQNFQAEQVDKKQVEYNHMKVEGAWVSFVCQVLENNKVQMEKLREDFYLVIRVVESPDVLVPASKNNTASPNAGRKWWGGVKPPLVVEEELKVDPELRQQLLSEHILFFNQKILEIENDMANESNSLGKIRDSLGDQRHKLELEIGSSEFTRDSLQRDDHDLLDQLTAMLMGPVKNLGDFD